jgi:hypothetical protein
LEERVKAGDVTDEECCNYLDKKGYELGWGVSQLFITVTKYLRESTLGRKGLFCLMVSVLLFLGL